MHMRLLPQDSYALYQQSELLLSDLVLKDEYYGHLDLLFLIKIEKNRVAEQVIKK